MRICDDLKEAIGDAEIIALITRYEEFRQLPELLKAFAPQPIFVDARRMLE